jgi:hypothetical protein
MRIRLAAPALAIALGLLPVAVSAQTMPSMMVQRGARYDFTLTVGPVAQMISPSQAMSGATGEVMVNAGAMTPSSSMGSSSMSSPSMGSSSNMGAVNTSMDQGMPANYHLEVQIRVTATNALVTDATPPTIRITNKSTGQFRDLTDVMGMYDSRLGMSDFHYGQNVFLPDGTYIVDVMLNGDSGEFRDVTVAGGMPMANMSMPATTGQQSTPTGMSNTTTAANPDVASDGATLAGQSASVQALFNAIWGARAAAEWAAEHTAALGMH